MVHREIERKFLVRNDSWRHNATGLRCRQGYLLAGPPLSVRIRSLGDQGFLTIKHAPNAPCGGPAPIDRIEFEYEVPLREAEAMLDSLCQAIVDKTRYRIPAGKYLWEVDEFHGANDGLVVAEIELESVRAPFVKPDWLGEEVSHDPRYLNTSLAHRPFSGWRDSS